MYLDNGPITKPIWVLPGMENFTDYYVDSLGNIWSTKRKNPKILNTSWMKGPGRYRMVCLIDKNKKTKTFCVHRLVALAFLPHDNYRKATIRHKNGIEYDNRVENLRWHVTIKEKKKKEKTFGLEKETFDRVNDVVVAASVKGLPMSASNKFLDKIINDSIDEFVKQYGLHKVMGS